MAFTQSGQFGAYVPLTYIWDTQQLVDVDVTKPEFKELLIRLYQNLNVMANVLNVKDSGYYFTNQEFVNGQQYFPNPNNNSSTMSAPIPRQVFRVVINFGALPNATTQSVAHGITCNANTTFTRIYGCATNPSTEYIPLPYSSATSVNDNIELYVDTTNVNVKTAANYSTYTVTYIIVEYLKT